MITDIVLGPDLKLDLACIYLRIWVLLGPCPKWPEALSCGFSSLEAFMKPDPWCHIGQTFFHLNSMNPTLNPKSANL